MPGVKLGGEAHLVCVLCVDGVEGLDAEACFPLFLFYVFENNAFVFFFLGLAYFTEDIS